jgi:CDP-ribitol ribitolphosphotransferase / teichoic acid ribitol-phosphate polymerase
MNFKYKLFAYFFNFFRIFNSEKKDVSFIIDKKSSFYGNLSFIKNELDKKADFNYNYVSKEEYSFEDFNVFRLLKFFLIKSFKLSKSKYIFLNDNFFPLAFMNFDENTTVIQVWHAAGAFKYFGFLATKNDNTKKLIRLSGSKLDYVVVSSKNVSKFYEEGFSVDNSKILSFGVPKTDYYFNNKFNNTDNIKKIRKYFEKEFPEIIGKKIVLYVPTFRENLDLNSKITDNFDFDLFNENLKENYVIFFRYHPKFIVSEDAIDKNNIDTINKSNTNNTNNINKTPKSAKKFINVSYYPNVNELLLIADILITDYSSIMIEFAILDKPIIFYPYDLEYYINNERGFYFDYNNVPGHIAKNTNEIIDLIKNNEFSNDKIHDFLNFEFDYFDGNSSERIVNFILNQENKRV